MLQRIRTARFFNLHSLLSFTSTSLIPPDAHSLSLRSTILTISIFLIFSAEIFNLYQFNIVFKMLNDVILYVIGDYEENEVLLMQLLTTVTDCINYFTK